MSNTCKKINDARKREKKVAQKHRQLARYLRLNSMLGNTWAIFFVIVGARKTGKSYAVADFLANQKRKLREKCTNYWFRISPTSTQALLAQNAKKLIDPDIQRKYNLSLKVKDMDVYNDNDLFCSVAPLASFGKLKGIGFYDKDYDGWYNIVLDEFQLETGEKRTSFDILYNFAGMCENTVRTTKSKIRVFLLGNTLEEASTVLKAFDFIPEKFGRFYLHSKRCVIDNIEVTEEYLEDRRGSVADTLLGETSNFTNEFEKDKKQLWDKRLQKITGIIKFTREKSSWFTIYDGKVLRRYRGEGSKNKIAMRPYLEEVYNRELALSVIERYDARAWFFDSLITQAYFTGELEKLRKK